MFRGDMGSIEGKDFCGKGADLKSFHAVVMLEKNGVERGEIVFRRDLKCLREPWAKARQVVTEEGHIFPLGSKRMGESVKDQRIADPRSAYNSDFLNHNILAERGRLYQTSEEDRMKKDLSETLSRRSVPT